MDTKPLMRLITDEVEMANLHSTIWETVHFAVKPWLCETKCRSQG